MNDSNSVENVMIATRATRITSLEKEFDTAIQSDSRFICARNYDFGLSEIAYASKRSVAVCSLNGHLSRRFTVDYDINKIMWTQFSRTKDDRKDTPIMHCLAIIGDQDITFYNVEDSHPFSYFVPFRIRNAYQVKHGLLIEQLCTREEEFQFKSDGNVSLFSLTHPLNELLPVLYRPKELLGPWLFCWDHEELNIIDAYDDLILTADKTSKTHRLYYIRHTLAEELKSSLFLMRNQQMEKRQNSTPQGPHYSTPKIQTNSRGGHQQMSVQTRSMLRIGRTRNLLVESPALSNIGTPPGSELSYDASLRLRSLNHPSLISSKGVNITKILERDLNNDIFYADFCLECVWAESQKKECPGYFASKMFLSQSFCHQTFVNIFIPEAKLLKCFRTSDSDHKTIVQTSLGTISCLDATYTPKNQHTVVLESEHLFTLYSGHSKVCTISYPSIVEEGIRTVYPLVSDTLAIISRNNKMFTLKIRPIYGDRMVEDLFNACILALASHEKSSVLLSQWRVFNAHEDIVVVQRNNICPLLHAAFRFILQEIGVTIVKHPIIALPTKRDRQDQPHSKVRRPPLTREEMLQRLNSFGEPSRQNRSRNVVEIDIDPTKPLFLSFHTLFAAMHSVWQQWGLRDDWNAYRAQVVHYLDICANVLNNTTFSNLYFSEFPMKKRPTYKIHNQHERERLVAIRNAYVDNPFSLFSLIGDILLCSQEQNRFNTQVYTYSSLIAQFVLAIATGIGIVGSQVDVQRLLGKRWKKLMPLDTDGDILKIILRKHDSKEDKCAKLLKIFQFDSKTLAKLPCVFQLLIAKIVQCDREAGEHLYPQCKEKILEFPATSFFNDIAVALWPTDKRSVNVNDMLRSDKPVLINTSALAAIPNQLADEREAQEIYLHGTCIRYLAQSFGRAMKNFRYLAQLPCHPETGSVAVDLCLSAKLFPSNLSYEIPPSDATKPYREWGEFYNGVASALRIGSGNEIKLDGEYLLSTCVKQEKVTNPTAAGLLYGFALNGHLLSNTYYVSEMLITLDEFQSVALLLGYGIAKMGTADTKIYKMLGTQLPFIMGPTNLPINIPSINQTAAIASLGFLFAQTGNTVLVKKLLNEIGKSLPPEESPATDRYAYRLNAGFAVGLICLGQGNDIMARRPTFEEQQPSVVDRLIHMMKGHPRKTCVFSSNHTPIMENNSTGVQQPLSRHIKERECVNTHLSSQAACIALGLMFFQTGNKTVSNHMLLPQDARPLEQIRPDLILARILCYHLVMWNDIEPTIDFVQKLVPKVVEERMHIRSMIATEEGNDDPNLLDENFLNRDSVFDLETLAQVYCNVVAGSALAIGLRFKNARPEVRKSAYDTILIYTRLFLPTNSHRYVRRFVELAGTNVHSLVINCLLISLGLLATTTGDLEAIRIARSWRVHEHVMTWMRSSRKHQEQMVAHQVLGMLFLGEGTYAWKEDILSNALLFISFYPQACHGINDSRFYHQPLRFLWTQAVEPRLTAIRTSSDLAEKYTTKAEIHTTYLDGKISKFESPTIIPPIELLRSLEIGGPNLETLKYDLTLARDREAIKRSIGYNHGRFFLHDYRHDETALTDDDFAIKLPNFKCLFVSPCDPSEAHKNVRFKWPSLQSIAGVKKQMVDLQERFQLSTRKGYIAPELIFAEKLAIWAKEAQLAFALEYAIDMLHNDQGTDSSADLSYNQIPNVEADKENAPTS